MHDTTAAAGDGGDPGDSLLYLSRIWRDVVTIISYTAALQVPTDTGEGVIV